MPMDQRGAMQPNCENRTLWDCHVGKQIDLLFQAGPSYSYLQHAHPNTPDTDYLENASSYPDLQV